MSAASPIQPIHMMDPVTLTLDPRAQIRTELDKDRILEYAEGYANRDPFPPLVIFSDGVTRWVADGFHRREAAIHAKLSRVSVDVRPGGVRDAILYACGANDKHGLKRTNDDKRRAVLTLLRDHEWSQKSDCWIAEACGVTDVTVGRARRKININNVDVDSSRVGRDGKNPEAYEAHLIRAVSSFLSEYPDVSVTELVNRLQSHSPTKVIMKLRRVRGDFDYKPHDAACVVLRDIYNERRRKQSQLPPLGATKLELLPVAAE